MPCASATRSPRSPLSTLLITRRVPCTAPSTALDQSPAVYVQRITRLRRTVPPFSAPSPADYAPRAVRQASQSPRPVPRCLCASHHAPSPHGAPVPRPIPL